MFSLWENKSDEVGGPALDTLVKTFMQHNGIPESLHFKVSAKTGSNLKEAFESVVMALDTRSISGLVQSDEHHAYVDLKALSNHTDAASTSSNTSRCHRC